MAKRIIRREEVLKRTGLALRTMYAEISGGRFPRPIPLTARSVGWEEDAVEAWIEQRIAAARDGGAAA